MNHADVRARMADYLEGHLALTDRALLDAHLDACAECSAEVAEMRATIALLRTLPEPQVPGDFAANVMRRIRAGEAAPTIGDRVAAFFDQLLSPRILAPASAAVLSAGLVLWGQHLGILAPGGPPASVLDARAQSEPVQVARADAETPRPAYRERAAAETSLASLSPPISPSIGFEPGPGPAGPEVVSDAPGPILTVRIWHDGPPPLRMNGSRSLPAAQVPFRTDWPGSASAGSIPVTTAPTPMRPESSMGGFALDRSAAPSGEGHYGIAGEGARGELRSRDDWLAVLEASPREFAARLSRMTLAEQEIWIDRLARHAAEQGSLDRVIERLRSAGGADGRVLAEDFAAVGRSGSDLTPDAALHATPDAGVDAR